MRTLFNDFYAPTAEGDVLEREAHEKISGIFQFWVSRGYSPREISAVLHMTVCNSESEHAIRHAANKLEDRNRE